MTIAIGRVYQRTPNVELTEAAALAPTRGFFSSWFWRMGFWFWRPRLPQYVDFSISYALSESLANVIDGVELMEGDTVLTLNVNVSDAVLLTNLQTQLAAYLTGFFGVIFTVDDIRGCTL